MPRLVIMSDTHGLHHKLTSTWFERGKEQRGTVPEGDILIHCGDFSSHGREVELQSFLNWMKPLPHPHKVVINGNHEVRLEYLPNLAEKMAEAGVTYLQDSGVEICGLKFWGSPWTPRYYDWAYNLDRLSTEMQHVRDLIPSDTEVLITHGPPWGILDEVPTGFSVEHTGCEVLAKTLQRLTKLRLHCFGHIHCAAGSKKIGETMFINAAMKVEGTSALLPPTIYNL